MTLEDILSIQSGLYYNSETGMLITLNQDNDINVYFEISYPNDIDHVMTISDHNIDINVDSYNTVINKINVIANKINTGELKL